MDHVNYAYSYQINCKGGRSLSHATQAIRSEPATFAKKRHHKMYPFVNLVLQYLETLSFGSACIDPWETPVYPGGGYLFSRYESRSFKNSGST